jgi:hypothetical protein
MSSSTFGHHPWTVQGLVEGVSTGQIRLPDIQRPFVWSNAKIRDLIDSMYKGYPVGELMFWENSASEHTKTIGSGEKTQTATLQVVDGQQRLTSLYAVVKGLEVWREDYSKEKIRIAFNPITERFDVPNVTTMRSPEWIGDIVDVFGGDQITSWKNYIKRLQDSGREVDDAMESHIANSLEKLRRLLSYEFQVVQLKSVIKREEVSDIFVRINSEGVSLTSADFILTWLSVFWEDGRTQLEEFARDSRFSVNSIQHVLGRSVSWTPQNPYLNSVSPGQLLRVVVAYGLRRGRLQDAYNALRGRDPRTREIVPELRDVELARLKIGQERVLNRLHWDEFLKVLERAGFRSSDMITSTNTVLYTYAVWLTGRVDFGVDITKLREVMARWFFMSQMTGRYTNSPESQIQEDISRLDGIASRTAEGFISELDAMIKAAVPDDYWRFTLVENLITSSVTAPAYMAYLASLNILSAQTLLAHSYVRDWIDPNRRPLKGIERHHLYPKAYLKTSMKITKTSRINQVANFALVEWSRNIDISDEAPSDYWPEQLATTEITGETLKKQMEWHALPDGWESLPFDEFLNQRRVLMAHVTHEGFKRLTNPGYEPDLTRIQVPESLNEISRMTLGDFIAKGLLVAGDVLIPRDDEMTITAEITSDGGIQIGSHQHEELNLAMHSISESSEAPLDFWCLMRDGERITLRSVAKGDSSK